MGLVMREVSITSKLFIAMGYSVSQQEAQPSGRNYSSQGMWAAWLPGYYARVDKVY
jgi:hypothetical protein